MRILALDYGERRTGVALSDPTGTIATGLDTIEHADADEAVEAVAALVEEHGAGRVVVGLPLNMDGSEGPQARKVRSFVKVLSRRVDVPVETVDERLTTSEAHDVLSQAGATNRVRRSNVDRMSAQLILRRYLDRAARPD